MVETSDIQFVNLGVSFRHLPAGISIGGITISSFFVLVLCGIVTGCRMSRHIARNNGENPSDYLTLTVLGVLFGAAGAHLFYVILNWERFQSHPLQILQLDGGGMEFYGALGAGVLADFLWCLLRRRSFGKVSDTAAFGLLLAQTIGEWGNFFSCQAFGGYTNRLFAMRISASDVRPDQITRELADHIVTVRGSDYIQVHPLFFYRSLWLLILLLVCLAFRGRRRWDGEIFCWYLAGYGSCRLLTEGLAAAPIVLPGTGIPAAQMIAAVTTVLALLILLWHILHPLRPITIHVTAEDGGTIHPHSLRRTRIRGREIRGGNIRGGDARREKAAVHDKPLQTRPKQSGM